MNKILVWDWPVRVGHWLLVGAVVLAWLTSESEALRWVHAFAGGMVVGIVLFRLVWGVLGTRHARFASFVRGPAAALAYLAGLFKRGAVHPAGHNAAGGLAIVVLLAMGLLTGASGWLAYQDLGGEWFGELHEGLAVAMLGVAAAHVTGVVVGSFAQRENLVRAMFTGLKQGQPDEAIAHPRPLVLLPLLVWVVACAWWLAR